MTLEFRTTEEIAQAKADARPIVALESTIITHGMPYPQNVETALTVEDAVRRAGAVPATIVVRDGCICIGQSADDIESLAQLDTVQKLSRADLSACIATGGSGSTTVAATMILAAQAGIEVFATGGIGGVHRGAEQSFDVSADLTELSQTPVIVVSAGPKAILDLPKTFEVLETLGVPVIAYGQDQIPAFWSRSSGIPAPLRMDSAETIAKAHRVRQELGLSGGQLVCNPIPQVDEISSATLEPIIQAALAEADAKGISAKAVTPFLLDRIFHLTNGSSLTANVALVLNNARLAAKIATAMTELR